MNNGIFRLVFNRERGVWMAAAEFVRGHGKAARAGRRVRHLAALALLAAAALDASAAARVGGAVPRLPAGTVPIPVNGGGAGFVSQGTASYADPVATATGKALTIFQTSQKAVLNWDSFNVAAGSSVNFSHSSASAATLNKIGSADPSVIQGMITSTARDSGGVGGAVYLINRNGILFDKGAQVNVGGLIASALDLADDVFMNSLLSVTQGTEKSIADPVFTWGGSAEQFRTSYVRVEAGADIATSQEGRVMLLAPTVENRGSIATPQGQAILAAGAKVYLASPVSGSKLRGFLVEVDPYVGADADGNSVTLAGSVSNHRSGVADLAADASEINDRLRANGAIGAADLSAEQLHARVGRIVAERGNITLAALAVNQGGLMKATTSVDMNGSIYLQARDTVIPGVKEVDNDKNEIYNPLARRMGTLVFGAGSLTEVNPDTASTRTLRDDQTFNKSEVRGSGKTITVADNAAIVARAGEVSLTAQDDIASATDLFGDLADNQARVYLAAGSRIDVSGLRDVALSVERNVIEAELLGNQLKDSPLQRNGVLAGKKVLIDIREGTTLGDVSGYIDGVQRGIAEKSGSGGSIVLKSEGDVVVRAGSSLDVSGGSIAYAAGDTGTTKLVSQGQSFDIATASAERSYSSFVKDTDRYEAGYAEGMDAGAVAIYGNKVALDGSLKGTTVAGIHQRDVAKRPLGAKLTVGKWTLANDGVSAGLTGMASAVRFGNGGNGLPASFGAADALPGTLNLDSGIFTSGGFTRLQLASANRVDLPSEVRLVTGPGGELSITGRRIDVQGTLATPGGSIALTTLADSSSVDAADFALTLGGSAQLSTAGAWVSDMAGLRSGDGSDPLVQKGGTISLISAAGLSLAAGSLLDVSGGGWQPATGKYKFGDAGTINLTTGTMTAGARPDASMTLAGSLAGYGLSNGVAAGKGGSLNITASNVTLGSSALGGAGELHLGESFFSQGGFRNYSITSRNQLSVAAGASIRPAPASRVVGLARSGRNMSWAWTTALLPELIRSAGSLTLATLSRDFGDLTVGTGARLAVDPGGSIALTSGKSIYVDGTLEAAGGGIRLTQTAPTILDDYLAERSIWLGANARLLARGHARLTPNASGLRQGSVFDGGSIAIDAAKGYLVSEQGALLDVSGTAATLDFVDTAGARPLRVAKPVGSNGGTVSLAAREGMLLDGNMKAQGGAGALGGTLAVAFDRGSTSWISFDPDLAVQLGSPRRLVLTQNHDAGTGSMTFGQAIDTASPNGLATVAADKIEAGGFTDVTLTAQNAIELDGTLSLTAQRAIRLDAPNLKATGNAAATLHAGLVSLGNGNVERQGAGYRNDASTGNGVLTVNANHITLEGTLTQQGFAATTLNSTGDVMMNGVVAGSDYKGAFISGGDIAINAARIYPSTLSDFAVEIHNNAAGTISIGHLEGQSGRGGAVLSAGARLALAAPNITQGGTIKVPFGTIELRSESIVRINDAETRVARPAGGTVSLADGSVTSVSGEGQVIPFGKTDLSGQDWIYLLGATSRAVSLAPEKRVLLDGDKVAKSAGASIDLSGGGDMKAWEFLPGTGGSKDVLDPAVGADTYAIVPTLQGAYAPYDLQSWSGTSGLAGGDSIVLGTGVGGLAAGTYVLLPARYALLPGAYTVTFTGTLDAQAGRVQTRPDGGWQVAANRATATLGGLVTAARSELVEIAFGDVARTRSEYIETAASKHFAGGSSRLPGDAGQLAVRAGTALKLGGTLNTGFAANHRGAEVDITANKLAVVAHVGTDYGNGYMTLATDTLNQLGAASLVLGGIRSRDENGTTLTVGASDVVLDNAGSVLSAPDLVLAASDKVTVAENAAVSASGGAGAEALRIAGDGALLRVSGNGLGGLVRTGTARTMGTLEVQSGATLSAAAVTLDATRESSFAGTFGKTADGEAMVKALALGASRINLGEVPVGADGLTLNTARLTELGAIDTLRLKSYTSIDLYGKVGAGDTLKTLELQAGGIAGVANAGQTASLAAGNITLSNPDGIDFEAAKPAGLGSGTLKLDSTETITLGVGDFKVAGFDDTTLHAGREIVATGSGSHSNAGTLRLEAGRITASSSARQKIASASALVTTAVAQTDPFSAAAAGGQMSLSGATLDHGGRIDLSAGKITLTATAGELKLLADSQLNAQGTAQAFADTTVFASGGQVVLESRGGSVTQDAAATIDVSGASDAAGNGGHAGALSVVTSGTASLGGAIDAAAGSAATKGGRFSLDAGSIGGLTALAGKLDSSGFSESVALRARSGDMTIDAGTTLKAHDVLLAADNGNLTVAGMIDASGSKGGRIELYANRGATAGTGKLTLSGALKAAAMEVLTTADGTRGRGGDITLGVSAADAGLAEQARLILLTGSSIDVNAASGSAARGGKVLLRAPRVGSNGIAITGSADGALTHQPGTTSAAIGTTITGASSMVAEAVRVYETTGDLTINTAQQNAWKTDTAGYMANAAAIKTRLGWTDAASHLRPGIEARATGDITLATDWDFQTKTGSTYDWRYVGGTEPGLLTLRSEGSTSFNANLSDGVAQVNDHANPVNKWFKTVALDSESWSYRIGAGADLSAADPLTVKSVAALTAPDAALTGNITLAAKKYVRTGTGFLDMAAGGNIVANNGATIYTAGRSGDRLPYTSPITSINGPGYIHYKNNPSFSHDGGDLTLYAQNDITFGKSAQFIVDWLWRQGKLQDDGTLGNNSSNPNTAWWVNLPQFNQGIGALGGGDVMVQAGRNITGLSVSSPTSGFMTGDAGTKPAATSLAVFGGGDIAVRAGQDVTSGTYYAAAGNIEINAGGAFGKDGETVSLALGDSRIHVEAGSGINIARIEDPFLLNQASGNTNKSIPGNGNRTAYFSSYTSSSAVNAISLNGDVMLGGSETLAPPTLTLAALEGSLNLKLIGTKMTLAPAPAGNLNLLAADSIKFDESYVTLSDAPISALANPLTPKFTLAEAKPPDNRHSSPVLHEGDPEPVRVVALNGDIEGYLEANSLLLPKRATIVAGGDITNLGVVAQNLADTDTSRIEAGGDIVFESIRNSTGGLVTNTKGIEWGGPGRLEITAGGDIDLGSSKGVVTRGNLGNIFLPEGGASVFMQAGAATADYAGFLAWLEHPDQAKVRELAAYASLGSDTARAEFLARSNARPLLRDAFYAILRGVGRAAASSSDKDYGGGYDAIAALFPEATGPYRGNIDMFFSQVKTEQGGGIDLMAPGGRVNAGLAVSSGLAKGASELGIVTARGGSVRAFVRDEFAVNQSRVFTLQGGDILIWSSESDIDAGKGSKTAAATPPPQIIVRGDKIILDTSNSVSGSGIGVLLGKEGVAPGSVDLIAPKGTVIAGEAGIRATGDVVIPGKVSGADNIQAGGSKIGVPQVEVAAAAPPPPPPPTDAGKAAEQAMAANPPGAGSREPGANSILTVEVLGLGEDDERRNN
ncbi:MAG: filamentous hemagglutinin family protein [Pseudomonadota bacterium]